MQEMIKILQSTSANTEKLILQLIAQNNQLQLAIKWLQLKSSNEDNAGIYNQNIVEDAIKNFASTINTSNNNISCSFSSTDFFKKAYLCK